MQSIEKKHVCVAHGPARSGDFGCKKVGQRWTEERCDCAPPLIPIIHDAKSGTE
jgi:hypothetical protein